MPAAVHTEHSYQARCEESAEHHWLGRWWKSRKKANADMRAHNLLEHPDLSSDEYVGEGEA